jgi:TPR repeat protein
MAAVPEGPSESASVNPSPDVPQTSAPPAAKPTQPPAREIPKNTRSERTVENRKSRPAPAKAEKPPANTGDADFRKGEAYLYGRGARENCAEAVKSLKAASAQSNAKARSAFGTMYATGHCVPRDLPTSYLWFALALRVDPNNQILEKDLNAVWNQMTPPERQTATRMKQ